MPLQRAALTAQLPGEVGVGKAAAGGQRDHALSGPVCCRNKGRRGTITGAGRGVEEDADRHAQRPPTVVTSECASSVPPATLVGREERAQSRPVLHKRWHPLNNFL